MRIVIVGAGEVGAYLSRFLTADQHDVTVIDLDNAKLANLGEQVDLRTLHGSGSDASVLESAEVERADLLLAMTDSDEINMLSVYFAKCLGVKRAVARVANDDVITGHPAFYREKLGMDMVVNPSMLTAAEAIGAILPGSNSGIAEIGFGRIHCRSFEVFADSPITRKPLKDQQLPGALIVATIREAEVVIPRGDDVMQEGDRLVSICRMEAIPYLQKAVGEPTDQIKRVFIVGGGNIGAAVAQYFDSSRYIVKLFEDDEDRAWELAEMLTHVKVLNSDGLDITVLEAEYLNAADAFIAATGSDEKNLMACALAREHGVARVIAVVDNPQYTALGQKLGLTATLAPRLLAAGQILTLIAGGAVNRISLIAEGKAEVVEFQARRGFAWLNTPLSELNLPRGIIIGALLRKNKAVIPKGSDEIHVGDTVVVFALASQVPLLEKLLAQTPALPPPLASGKKLSEAG